MAHDDLTTIKPVQRAVRLTRIGLVAQGICRAFWPLWSVLIALIGALMFGVQDVVAPGVFWVGLAAFCAAALWFGVKGAREFEIPSDDDALAQVDAALPGRPLSTLRDTIAIGAGDPASVAVWLTIEIKIIDGVNKNLGIRLSINFKLVLIKPECSATPTPSMGTSTTPSPANVVNVFTIDDKK